MSGISSSHPPEPAKKAWTLWFTGLSGSGKSTLAALILSRLRSEGLAVELLDGDALRTTLCKDLGFSKEHRDENVRRIGFLCEILAHHGVTTVVAAVSPYRAARDEVRAKISNFVEIHVTCPIEVLIQRDPKGLYKKALAGEVPNFTGISDLYEPPSAPELTIDSSEESPAQSLQHLMEHLEELGILSAFTSAGTLSHS